EHGLADLHRTLTHRVFLDDRAALALDGAGHSRAHQELGVGRVDDRIDLRVRDVAELDRDGGRAELGLHRPPPAAPPAGGVSCSSRAFTVSQVRSSSSRDALSNVRPAALISDSTSLKRRVNFSAALRKLSSASTPRRRATFTTEKRRSPSSSPTRSASPALAAWSSSAISSLTLVHASRHVGQSNPTRPAFTCRRWARSRAGRDAGTPSRADRALPSPRLIRSHWDSASAASAT